MEDQTLYIAISNQKGGVGKSALTTVIASYLHYNNIKNVAIIDCDYPQHSIFRMRNSDIETININQELQAALTIQFQQTARKAYKVINSSPEKALAHAQELINSCTDKIDVIFFDLPGTVDSAGILNVMFNMDYIFTPIIADKRVLQSSLSFLMSVKEYKRVSPAPLRLKDIILFWNKVDKRESTELYDFFNKLAKTGNHRILGTYLPDTKRYNKELSFDKPVVFRSTLFPPDKRLLKNSNLEELVNEISKIINL
jgi:cellulose biosynthesis protein BcsQ